MTWKARFLWAFLVSIGLTVMLALSAIVMDDMPYEEEILISVLLFAVHSLAALLGAVLWQRRRARRMVEMGVGAILAGGVVWITLIWADRLGLFGWKWQSTVAKCASTLTTPGLVLFVRALVLWPDRRSRPVEVLSVLCWVFGSLAGLIILSAIWQPRWWGRDDLLPKSIASCLIVAAGSGLAVFVVARLTQGDLIEHDDSALGLRMPVSLTCPRCQASLTLAANTPGRCSKCDLKLRVEFEEPRCSCGYLLHGLTGEVCPECGKAITERSDWSAEDSPNPPLSDGEPSPRPEGD